MAEETLSLAENFPGKKFIENVMPELMLLIEKLNLRRIDLILEGGVADDPTLAFLSKILFPEALYIGIDIFPYNARRRAESIDDFTLSRILFWNGDPKYDITDARIWGNCGDRNLIDEIKRRTGRRKAMFITKNALSSLLSEGKTLFEKKDPKDLLTIDNLLSLPVAVQLHMINLSLWDYQNISRFSHFEPFYDLEEAAMKNGNWVVERFSRGLLLVKKETNYES